MIRELAFIAILAVAALADNNFLAALRNTTLRLHERSIRIANLTEANGIQKRELARKGKDFKTEEDFLADLKNSSSLHEKRSIRTKRPAKESRENFDDIPAEYKALIPAEVAEHLKSITAEDAKY